ncbi:MAG: hypothetical protein WC473_04560 [Patescibacteria group bacterium]
MKTFREIMMRLLEVIGGAAFGLVVLAYFFISALADYRNCWLGWKDTAKGLAGWAIFIIAAVSYYPVLATEHLFVGD